MRSRKGLETIDMALLTELDLSGQIGKGFGGDLQPLGPEGSLVVDHHFADTLQCARMAEAVALH